MRRFTLIILTIFLMTITIAYATDYVLIIGGVGGEKSYYDKFWSATSRFHQLLTQQYGYSPEQITFLFEDQGNLPGLVTGEAKRQPILDVFTQLADKVKPTDRFILFMIGHASRASDGVKFNLLGRDISQQEYTDSINKINAEQQLLIFGFQYSARVVRDISKSGRIILTSSSAREGYSSQVSFGDLFVDAFSESSADNNSDGAISIFEAFLWMQKRTDEWYEQEGVIQAEHPHLDDNGDGKAVRKDLETSGEGTLADKVFLGKRLTPLPPPEENTTQNVVEEQNDPDHLDELTPVHEEGEEHSEENVQTGMQGKSSLPYSFISEEDEQAIQASITNAPNEPAHLDDGAIVLWESEDYDVDENTSHVYSTRRVVKIFNKDGFHLGEIKIPYTLGADDVTIHHARTLLPDGSQVELDQEKIVRGITPASAAEAGLSVSTRLMYFELPKMTDGCIIDYAYSAKNPPSVMKGEFWRHVHFQIDNPVQYYRLATHLPKKLNLLFRVNGPTMTPTITENNYTRTYTFEATDIPALRREPLMPAVSDFAYSISLSTIDSWDRLLTWYATLIREQDRSTEEIVQKTNALLKGALTRNEKIKRLYEFVATKIQYAGDEKGIWAIKPYPAAEVLKKEWGDCKGKSTLLSTMLRIAGIDSYPVLISAGKESRVIREVPSLSYFNHMILAVDGGKDKDLIWLDPTARTTPFGDFPVGDQNRWTVIINTDAPKSNTTETQLVDIEKLDGEKVKERLFTFQKSPALPANSNKKRTSTHVRVKKDLSVEVTQELWVSGDFNARLRARILNASNRDERIQLLREALELDERAIVDDLKISEIEQLSKDLTVEITWLCREYVYEIGGKYILELPVVKHPYAILLSEEDREHPVVIGKTLTLEDDITVDVDAPFTIEAVPESKKQKTDVAAIDINWELDFNRSRRKAAMKQNISYHAPSVKAEHVTQLTNIVRLAASRSTKRIILTQNSE